MDFVSNKEAQIKEMLKALGKAELLDLYEAVPKSLILPPPSHDDGLSEMEGLNLMESLAQKNSFPSYKSYLGAGAYDHYVPALVGAVISKSEFLTAYTPYQAEASQGMLEAIFEYQSAVAALTGMEVANASVWDAASATAEAALMAIRIQKGRDTLFVADTLNPRYLAVLKTYLASTGVKVAMIPFVDSGQINLEVLSQVLNDKSIGVLIQSPNVLGVIEPSSEISRLAHEKGALVIQNGNPLAYALFAPPGETGVDIAVGDTQPFGIPLQFGGPYAGYMATRLPFVRQLPGRLVGETVDNQGRKGYTLTLQAREQHIRREKALSNICTNQALMALSSLVAILWYGKEGVKELALTNYQRAAYLKNHLPDTLSGPVFNEFAVRFKRPLDEVKAHFRRHGIEPGWECPLFSDCLIVAVTEKKTKADLDRYLEVAHDCI